MDMEHVYQEKKPPRAFYDKFEPFYEAYYKTVLGYLKKKVNSLQDAEDIAGKVFLYCFEKWETYDPSKASQITWLFMIVRSRWADFVRRNRTFADIDRLGEILADDRDPIGNAVWLESVRRELASALEELPENQRKAVVMRYFGDYTDAEIADRLDTTPGNVRVIIHRGLNRLRAEVPFGDLL